MAQEAFFARMLNLGNKSGFSMQQINITVVNQGNESYIDKLAKESVYTASSGGMQTQIISDEEASSIIVGINIQDNAEEEPETTTVFIQQTQIQKPVINTFSIHQIELSNETDNAEEFLPYDTDNSNITINVFTQWQKAVLQNFNQRRQAILAKFEQRRQSVLNRFKNQNTTHVITTDLNNNSLKTTDGTEGLRRLDYGKLNYNNYNPTPTPTPKPTPTPVYNTAVDRQEGLEVNGKLDKDFSQGQTGDCWFLSTLQAIKDKDGGAEYLNSLLKVDDKTGDVTVNLKGANKSYTISQAELQSRGQLSSGDGDVRALEIAMDRYLKETNRYGTIDKGNSPSLAMEALVGNGSYNSSARNGIYGEINTNRFNSKNQAFTVSFEGTTPNGSAYNTATNNYTQIVDNHAYSILKADKENVYLKNPWNTSEVLKVDKGTFQNMSPSICSTFLKKTTDK